MRARRHIYSVLLLAPLIGCIAIVPSYEPKDHCEFSGDNPCATCMRMSCQAQIDACCSVDKCHDSGFLGETGTTIAGVDTCARGEAAACQSELDYATKTPEGENVRVCIETTCKAQCAPAAVATKWSCAAPRTETEECPACIYSKCSGQITTCCGSNSCAKYYGVEDDLTACISGDARACAYELKEDALAESGDRGILRRCIREDCGKKCLGDGSFHQSCRSQNGGRECTCTDAATLSTSECSKTSVTNGRCYETEGGCACGHLACKLLKVGRSCSCDLSNEEEGDASERCSFESLGIATGGVDIACCLIRSGPTVSCKCDASDTDCTFGGEKVQSCDHDYLVNTGLKSYATSICSK